ncbi:MAG: T9SS type A sorting domain-containing protein [Lewinellaceae bacterium]|nr:T9SS type A sorting domain-containing protein [Lewinellaceae bacterium]
MTTTGQGTYNVSTDIGWPTNHFRDMIVDNDTIIGYGLGYADSTYAQQGLILSKFDSSGNHLFSRMILDPLGEHLSISYHWGKIAKTRDGGYIMTAAPTHGDAAWLIKVGHDFEVEFIKEYLDTVNRSHYRYNVPIELEDGYLLSGSIQRLNYLNNPFARRVDKQGNTIWFKYFGAYDVAAVFNDMVKVNDSIFLAFSTTEVADNPGIIASAINYIDWNGDILRSWQSEPDPEIGFARKALPTADDGIITFGQYPVEVINEVIYVQPTLAKLDSNFQIEWIRHFGYVARLSAKIIFWDIEPLSDGNYIGAGESANPPGSEPRRRTGWLHKFSPQGDSLWEALPEAPFLPASEYDVGALAGVGELASGSIVAAGEVNKGNQRYIWLVKVTPDGCLDTLCSVVSAVEGFASPEQASLSLFPNPTAGPLTLAWAAPPPGREAHLHLYDAGGREVWRQQRPVERQMELSLSGLPEGLYFLQVRTSEGNWVERVVVRRE